MKEGFVLSRPDCVTNEHLKFLDDLQAQGRVNIFQASGYIVDKFPGTTTEEALEILGYWIKTCLVKKH